MKNTHQIYQQFKHYGSLAQKYQNKAKALLPLIAQYNIHHKYGFSSVTEMAAKLANISPEN